MSKFKVGDRVIRRYATASSRPLQGIVHSFVDTAVEIKSGDCYQWIFEGSLELVESAPVTTRRIGNTEYTVTMEPLDFSTLEPPQPKVWCTHTYARYVGLTDTFEYCTKCDEKKV